MRGLSDLSATILAPLRVNFVRPLIRPPFGGHLLPQGEKDLGY